jgi:hypothetical protein
MLVALLVPALTIGVAAPVALASSGGSSRQLAIDLPPLMAGMKGANENPPADPDAAGYAVVDIHIIKGEVCVEDFAVGGATLPLTLFHIHKGGPTENGPIVVDFVPLLATGGIGCVPVSDRGLLRDIEVHPGNYYLNVHTTDFMAGALRGQLVRTLPF